MADDTSSTGPDAGHVPTDPAHARDRPILITGAAQGIGRVLVAHALAEGRSVLALDVDADAADELRKLHAAEDATPPAPPAASAGPPDASTEETPRTTRRPPARLEVVVGDVADEDAAARAVRIAVDRFGGLAGLVNNAGIGAGGSMERLDLRTWNRVLAVNLTGAFLMVKHAAPHLRRAQGAVVNIASTRSQMSEPDTEAYAAAKGGLVALTHALAISLGPDVRVNAVSPGWIEVRDRKKGADRREPDLRPVDHAQHPVGRVGTPEDVAEMVLFLLSSRAGFMTGENVVLDGGMTRKMIYAG